MKKATLIIAALMLLSFLGIKIIAENNKPYVNPSPCFDNTGKWYTR